MTKDRQRKDRIRERMRETGEPFMVASRGIGEWWAANRKPEPEPQLENDQGDIE